MSVFDIDISVNDDVWNNQMTEVEDVTHSVIETILSAQLPHIEHIEVSVVLANDPFISTLNKQYRDKDKPTNVLSFPQTEKHELDSAKDFVCLGDIVVSYETIAKEAKEQNKTFANHYTHMLVHSCLHLLHYDHEDDIEAQDMENLEIKILKEMSIKNPYQSE